MSWFHVVDVVGAGGIIDFSEICGIVSLYHPGNGSLFGVAIHPGRHHMEHMCSLLMGTGRCN